MYYFVNIQIYIYIYIYEKDLYASNQMYKYCEIYCLIEQVDFMSNIEIHLNICIELKLIY